MSASISYDSIAPTVDRLIGSGAVLAHPIEEGAYSRSKRWLVATRDGTPAFVKAGLYPDSTYGLALEHAVYAACDAQFHPRLLAWEPGDVAAGVPSVIVLEDLSSAHWSVPLTREHVEQFASALALVERAAPPAAVLAIDPQTPHWRREWVRFARSPAPLLATGLVDQAWLTRHADSLARVERSAELRGDALVHGDLWRQNWCNAQRGAVLVDWSGATRGNPLINRAWGECGVRAAGGPPGVVFPQGAAEQVWATWMCGRALRFAVESAADPRPRLVETILREARAALEWMCEALELPLPSIAERARVPRAWRP